MLIELYLDFGMYLGLFWSLSSAVLQSTDYEIISHRQSVSANFPLNTGLPAVRAKNKGLKIAS